MLRACGNHSSWEQPYWGEYKLRKGSPSFWDQFLTKIPFPLLTWRVWIAKTSDFITETFTRSEQCWKDYSASEKCFLLCCLDGGGILQLDPVLRTLTSIRCKQERSSCIFLCVCCTPNNLNSRMLQSNCKGVGARGRMVFICIFSRHVIRNVGQCVPELETRRSRENSLQDLTGVGGSLERCSGLEADAWCHIKRKQ